MELYLDTSYELARRLTERYSTSFSMSSRLFDTGIRPHIYAIYGMVRIADEIVDTHKGEYAPERLDAFEADVLRSIADGYSSNPILHAFAHTARKYAIGDELIRPFFKSMKMDLSQLTYSPEEYAEYIYGSAEVVGLMCLRVFVDKDEILYEVLLPGARALGSAYQKVNFLRDIKTDYSELGRIYFPGMTFEEFDEIKKDEIVHDIERDFTRAEEAVVRLPVSSQKAVKMSILYYRALLKKLKSAPVEDIKSRRIRVPNSHKLVLFAGSYL